jgi:hypothetical protein
LAGIGCDAPIRLFEGETVYSQSEVLATRESKSHPDVGIVTVRTVGFTAEGKIVITFERTFMGTGAVAVRSLPPYSRSGMSAPCPRPDARRVQAGGGDGGRSTPIVAVRAR